MDFGTSTEREEIRQNISRCLDAYAKEVFAVNFGLLQKAISEVNAEFDKRPQDHETSESRHKDADDQRDRLDGLRKYLEDDNVETPGKLRDLKNISLAELDNPEVARRILPTVVTLPRGEPYDWKELQHDVQHAAEDNADVTLPEELIVLAGLAVAIYPPGLPINTARLSLSFPLYDFEAMDIEELKEVSHMTKGGWGDGGGYTIYAGFVIDPCCPVKFPPLFSWLLCARAATEDTKERPKAWRIVFTEYWYESTVFEDVPEFLRWFAGFNLFEDGCWDEECGNYVHQ